MEIKIPDSSSPSFFNELINLGQIFEEKVRPGCEFDLMQSPNHIWEQIQAQMLASLDKFCNSKTCPNGVEMLQWYNSGVFIRTSTVSIGFDILPIPRFYNWKEPENLSEQIASELDILCITHSHEDHFDEILINKMLDLKKPVLIDSAAIPEKMNKLDFKKCAENQVFDINETKFYSHKAFHVWRDHIDSVPLSYFEVSLPNGFNFIFSGDADYTKIFSKTLSKIDLLFIPWRNPNKLYEDGHPEQIGNTIDAIEIAEKRISPDKIILEHYGELDHIYKGFNHSFDLAEKLVQELKTNTEILFWGNRKTLK